MNRRDAYRDRSRSTPRCRRALRPRLEWLEDRLELALVAALPTEFHVNTTIAAAQQTPAIAVDPNGDFVVAWQSGDYASGYGIRAQRYNSAGVAQGGEITVNSSVENFNERRFSPSVAMDTNGDFVVAWDFHDLNESLSTDYDIFARRFNATGVAQGNEFRVNTTTLSEQGNSSVAMDAAGDFVVAWRSGFGSAAVVSFQRYNASGVVQGGQVGVDSSVTNTQGIPSAAMDQNGNFVIAWQGNSATLGDTTAGVFFQRYNSSGTAQGSVTLVNTSTTGTQSNPSVAMDATGNFDIAWSGNGTQAGQVDSQGIFFKRYNASGTALSSETLANPTPANGQTVPKAAISSTDYLTIAWVDDAADTSGLGVFARHFDPSGNPLGTSFKVNTTNTGNQTSPGVGTASGGNTVVVWQSPQESNGTSGIYGQRYTINFPPTANAQSVTVGPNTPKAITLTASDPESDALTYTVTTPPTHGTLSGTAPNLTYTPTAGYAGPDSFQFKANDGHQDGNIATVTLNVQVAVSSTVTAKWGTAGSATLATNADGLRLLPTGRSNDLPWLNVNKVQITLNQSATLVPGDVSVTGVNVANYGPVTISGSGTSYTITFAQPVGGADRVTLTIGNANIGTFTRRLDILPGDFNDDAVTTMQDAILIRNQYLAIGGATPTIFGDIDGNGVVDINDYNEVRRRLGLVLP